MSKLEVIIYAPGKEENREKSLKELVSLISGLNPGRIFISLESNSESVGNKLTEEFKNIPVNVVECDFAGKVPDKGQSTDLQVKRKVLELGLETIAKYVENINESVESLNSEITMSLFRAFFIFYSNAMPEDYEILYEDRRMCILGKLVHEKIEHGDLLIVSPWDAYWFKDEFEKL